MKRSRGYCLGISESQKKRYTDYIKIVAMEMMAPTPIFHVPPPPLKQYRRAPSSQGSTRLEGKNQDLPSPTPLLNDDTVSHTCVLKQDFIKPSDHLVETCMFPMRLGMV